MVATLTIPLKKGCLTIFAPDFFEILNVGGRRWGHRHSAKIVREPKRISTIKKTD